MMVVRFSRFLAAGALAWAGCVVAEPIDTIGLPALRLSTSLAQVPAEHPDAEAPADPAATGFTRRTQQPVEELQRTREQRERELLEALSKARQQQQATADIEKRLAEVRSERYANPVVYVLAALLAIVAAGALFFWQRTRPGRPEPAADPALQDGVEPA